ncbi:P-loop containing nucleoside triphosphate hydrolase protein [Epithele typhae]|uniref:P-loop containing nucleoside triphosphate hydrolase protein n=1 Tax=Epithele typhae TaxID=378194 RepID=UPI002008638F|nr:P-loop containing nucleoside triphosphate hydrolase protein [Epithele typhae]KAH9943433.1 P-loop containing nucleoside triphosphate hydrolase protein [Epithele typhae]
MPAFQDPTASGSTKRKFDGHDNADGSRKRQALDDGSSGGMSAMEGDQYWMVQWRNPQYKKHKTWDGDAVLVVSGHRCALYDPESRQIATGKPHGIEGTHKLDEGVEFTLGSKEIEIDHRLSREDFLSGRCFGNGGIPISTESRPSAAKQFVPLKPKTLNGKAPAHTPSSVPDKPKRGIPLEPVSLVASQQISQRAATGGSCWTANWRKPQQKKHKTWDGDGFVILEDDKLTFLSDAGLILGSRKWDGLPLYSSYRAFIGNREVELDSEIPRSQLPAVVGSSKEIPVDPELGHPPVSQQSPRPSYLLNASRENGSGSSPPSVNTPSSTGRFISPASFYGAPVKTKEKGPLHNPDAPGAVVMKAPTKEHQTKFNKKNLSVVPVVVDPVLCRHLRPHQKEGVQFLYECVMGLRKHEGQGCILADEMGMGKTLQTITLIWTLLKQNPYAGPTPVVSKVLIVCPVTLINNWKNEFHKWLGKDRIGVFVGDKDKRAIKQFMNSRVHQVLIIGYERLRTVISDLAYCQPPIGLIICDEGHRLKSANNKTSTMFDALRTPRRVILSGTPIQNELSEFHAMVSPLFILLDYDYLTFKRVYETPILKSRAPGCTAKEAELGEARSNQLTAIAKSFVLRRDATILKKYLPPKHEYVVFVTPTQLQLSIFEKFLSPDKLDNLVRNSTAESLALINMLTKISNSPILLKATADQAREKARQSGNVAKRHAIEEALKLLPERAQVEDISLSGKLTALATLLRALHKHTEEKCIVVSHYTSTLNIMEAYCKKKAYTYHRLDGNTPTPKRQEFVNDFNRSSQAKRFIFLLSSKAGGVGLNLIGASRLCLIDSDWNPSHDLQSMARIHRDGQKRPVYIYRFLTTGSIDEKIYQRQVTKLGLSDFRAQGTSDSKSDSFSRKDLLDIFRIHPDTACNTHDLLDCPCGASANGAQYVDIADIDLDKELESIDNDDFEDISKGFTSASQLKDDDIKKMDRAYLKQKRAQLASLGEWTHINCLLPGAVDRVDDDMLTHLICSPDRAQDGSAKTSLSAFGSAETLGRQDVPGGSVSFLFERTTKVTAEEKGGDKEDV